MPLLHLDITVRGHVQGVWYRKTTVETATRLGLTGYAMNRPDGAVFIEVEGDGERMNEFLAWCAQGPPLARVETVEHHTGRLKGYRHFETRR